MDRFYLKSFGCKVNQYDGQGLRERLGAHGYEETLDVDEADVVVVNFCVVTGRSASRCQRTLKNLARRRPGARLMVSGCLSPEDRGKVREACPTAEVLEPGDPWAEVSGLKGHTRAFLKVEDGCNLKCTYCIIPSIRGSERSRAPAEVSAQAGRLLEAGHRELVLCGIRLGGYRHDGTRLDGLLERLLNDHPGRFRIRLSSLNPAEVTPSLLAVMAGDERVARHLHLPLQSGDEAVLKRMKRPYSPGKYLEKVEAIRAALPEPALSTDLIVGFPGEDDEAFAKSIALLEEASIARVHVFPFSPREGTPAADLPRVPDRIRTERAREAIDAARRLKERYDRAFLGREVEVLVESTPDKATGLAVGLTSRYQKTTVPGEARGDFITVRLGEYKEGVFYSHGL
jgi:threonylcarbamoyladenosine tRNA methylthiotransferase MtaB